MICAICLYFSCCFLEVYSCFVSVTLPLPLQRSLIRDEASDSVVSTPVAVLLPFMGSLVLIVMYYYFKRIEVLVLAYTCVVSLLCIGGFAVVFV